MAVTLVVAATAVTLRLRDDGRRVGLVATESYIEVAADDARIGRPVNAGIGGSIAATGDRPVHVEAVEILGVPDGLRVEGVYADRAGAGMVGLLEGDLRSGADARDLRPVTDAVFVAGQPPTWYFVLVVVPERRGTYQTAGFRVSWRAGTRRGTTTYGDILRVKVT